MPLQCRYRRTVFVPHITVWRSSLFGCIPPGRPLRLPPRPSSLTPLISHTFHFTPLVSDYSSHTTHITNTASLRQLIPPHSSHTTQLPRTSSHLPRKSCHHSFGFSVAGAVARASLRTCCAAGRRVVAAGCCVAGALARASSLISYCSSHTTHLSPLISYHFCTTHHTPPQSHQSSLSTHHTTMAHHSRTTHHNLTLFITQPLISHHSSRTAHRTPLISHHASHTIHLQPFISDRWSHRIHLKSPKTRLIPLISHHSSFNFTCLVIRSLYFANLKIQDFERSTSLDRIAHLLRVILSALRIQVKGL